MSQNQIFSPQRFGRLLSRDLRENWRKLLLSLGSLLGALIIVALFFAVANCSGHEYFSQDQIRHIGERMAQSEVVFFTVIMFFIGALFASLSFKSFSSAPTALSGLMIPASQFEKFLMRWLIAVPCFFIAYVAFAIFADWIRVEFIGMHYKMDMPMFEWKTLFFHSEKIAFKYFSLIGILVFLWVQSFFFLGSIVWPRVSYLKTFASLFALSIIYAWFAFWLAGVFGDVETYTYLPPEWLDTENMVQSIMIPALVVLILFNYCLTFMRFKEAETIIRW